MVRFRDEMLNGLILNIPSTSYRISKGSFITMDLFPEH